MAGSTDTALARIAERLPNGWILQTIQIDEVDDYVVLLNLRGPAPFSSRPRRLFGKGRTIPDALWDALAELEAYLDSGPPQHR